MAKMRRYRRTTLITVGCLSVLAGLGLARKVNFAPQVWPILFIPFCLLLLRAKNATSLIIVIFLGLSLGLWRGGIYMQKLNELKNLSGQKITVEATATSDSVYSKGSQIQFYANRVKRLNSKLKPLAGSFKISGFGERMIYRGDRVQISGKFYPMRGASQGRIAYAQLTKVGLDSNPINKFTRKFSAGMQSALPEPNASFGLGLLIGQRVTLPQELTNQMIMVGLVHIVAVSGYNLTILVRAVARLKMSSKFQQLVLSLSLIAVFILMTGFAASIIRAAIVSVLSLWAWYYGRRLRPALILAFTAALTALLNPFYIWGDLGWYLSFLAFFGILSISPVIINSLFKKQPKLLASAAIETFCAEIMALPFIMLMFGQLSLIGLLANVLVVPLVPLAMLFSAIAAAGGMWLSSIAGWLALPANLLLTFMLDLVRLLAAVPGIFLRRSISMVGLLVFYASVLLIVIVAHRFRAPKNVILTDEKLAQGDHVRTF